MSQTHVDVLQSLLDALRELVDPVLGAMDAEDAVRTVLLDAGWDVDEVLGDATDLVTAVETLRTDLDDLAAASRLESLADASTVLAGLRDILSADAVEQLAAGRLTAPDQVAEAFAADLREGLLLHLIVRRAPVLYDLLVQLGLVRYATAPSLPAGATDRLRYPVLRPSLEPAALEHLLSDPAGYLEELYLVEGLDTPEAAEAAARRIFRPLSFLLSTLGAQVTFGPGAYPDLPEGSADRRSLAFLFRLPTGGLFDAHLVGGRLVVVPRGGGPDGAGPGLEVSPNGAASLQQELGKWRLTLDVGGRADSFFVRPGTFSGADGVDSVSMLVRMSRLPDSEVALVVGGASGTRLELGKLELKGWAELDPGQQDYGAMLSAHSGAIVVEPGDGDGFLQQILSATDGDGTRIAFDLGLGWSSTRGIHFGGGAGLEVTIPVHVSARGALTFHTVHLLVDARDGEVRMDAAVAGTARLGPLAATIDRVGLGALLSFPEAGGSLGPADLDLTFKPPDGVGLAVDAGAVVGGGYLFFDAERERYAGVAHLEVGDLVIKAVGLLTTRMPDGSEGFSLLVIITGEFPPIQLGFGFTLNGLGGLLGVNRSIVVDALRSGLQQGTLDSVMFPDDPVENAPRIISDLRSIFPPVREQYVFGPMAMLGWGTPPVLTVDLGLVLELFEPLRLVILGRLEALLPSAEADPRLVEIHMDVLGVIDFDRKEASVDAVLYDSRVAAYTLSGEMAMRTAWGADARFLMAVGGFNPRFQPPAGFPELDRLALSLGTGNNPRLRLESYLALTSNTVQVGSNLDLYAAKAGFSVHAYLGFDALFRFSPFMFVVDMRAGATLKKGSTTLMKVKLRFTLEGPQPWHAYGKATFEVLLLSASVDFDVTIGPREQPELPEADVWPELQRALTDARNWSARLPGGHRLVSLREARGEAAVTVHPLGSLEVRQQVTPLDVAIEKFGSVRPAGQRRFTIERYRIGTAPARDLSASTAGDEWDRVMERFAPAQYFDMTDEEKIAAPAFERMQAGLRIGSDRLEAPDEPADADAPRMNRPKQYRLVTVVVDEKAPAEPERPTEPEDEPLSADAVAAAAEIGATARSRLGSTGRARFHGRALDIGIDDARYTVATTDTLEPVSIDGLERANGDTYAGATAALRQHLAAHPEDRGRLQVVAGHELTVAT